MTKLGIIQEGKIPPDKRVPLTPRNCVELLHKYPQLKIAVQPSKIRVFLDEEYKALKIPLQESLHDCDFILGIKEVPIGDILENKKYLFFSHTIKKQPSNKKLLQTLAQKKCTLIDYECIKDEEGNRLISFGHFAGIVGAYNTFRAYGLKYRQFDLKPAHLCYDYAELRSQYKKIKLKPIKIVLTGGGRVAKGAQSVLNQLKIKEVNKHDFMTKQYTYPVYTMAHSEDFYVHRQNLSFDKKDFYQNPTQYKSQFIDYAMHADVFIACAYWNPGADILFTREDMRKSNFKLRVIGDITCDLNGSIPSTLRTSSIDNPFYDYNPYTEDLEVPFGSEKNITVMAIDNLPCELARDASSDFGNQLIKYFLDELIMHGMESELVKRATILHEGKLTPRFEYLQDYLE